MKTKNKKKYEKNEPDVLVILYDRRREENEKKYIVYSREGTLFQTMDKNDLRIRLDLMGGYDIWRVRYDGFRVRNFKSMYPYGNFKIVGKSFKLKRRKI